MTRWLGLSVEKTGELQLVLCSLCFGVGFIFQRWAELDTDVQPWSYSAARNVVSSVLMLAFRKCLISATRPGPTPLLQKDFASINTPPSTERASDKDMSFSNTRLWSYGLCCGLCNTFGSALQQIALVTVSAGKVAFITSLYMVIIPLLECDCWCRSSHSRLRRQLRTLAAALLAAVGVYLLSGCAETDVCIGGSLGLGEAAVMTSVLFWTASIIASDRAADDPQVNVISLTTIEFSSSALLGLALAAAVEPASFVFPWVSAQQAAVSIVAVGVTEAVGFTLCVLGQRYVGPSRASLLLSLEGAATALIGFVALGERLTAIELGGAALMMAATTLTSAEDDDDDDDEGEGEGEGKGEGQGQGQGQKQVKAERSDWGEAALGKKSSAGRAEEGRGGLAQQAQAQAQKPAAGGERQPLQSPVPGQGPARGRGWSLRSLLGLGKGKSKSKSSQGQDQIKGQSKGRGGGQGHDDGAVWAGGHYQALAFSEEGGVSTPLRA